MLRWFDERLALKRFYNKFLRKAFPVHHSFFLGEITLFAFVTLVLTGIFLSINFEPSIRMVTQGGQKLPAAYASVRFIDSLPFGMVIRSIHHWAANVMIAAAFLHMVRILLTGAYKKPREINWIIGICLLGFSIFAAFTGYSLPFDAFSATATKIGYNIASSLPIIGHWFAGVFFGGQFPTEHSIPRLNAIHILWLPLLLGVLIVGHVLIMYLQKHTQPRYAEKVAPGKILGVPFFPQQALIMAVLFSFFLGVVAILAAVFIANPIEVFGPPGPSTPEVKPEWYFLWIYGFLQMIPSDWNLSVIGVEIGPQFLGLVVPILVVILGFIFPFLDVSRRKFRYLELPSRFPWRTGAAMGVIGFFMASTLAAYRNDLGLSMALSWVIVVGTPLLFTVVTAGIIRLAYGPKKRALPAAPAPGVRVQRGG
ncbi:MAG TPA: cytochrome bc complex cytochrome b subunit [Trueperaceae bacterium]|nr:cytochrome bc complex cytochrome b subunit [Trueperaceae bacterium]